MAPEHATFGILVLILAVIGLVFLYISKARRGVSLPVRRLPGIDAIDEAVGRAAELGRPVSFTTGLTAVGPTLYACLGILYYVARKTARLKSRFFMPQSDPQVMAIAEDTAKEAYRAEGRLSSYSPKSNVFLSEEQFAYAAGYVGLVQREKMGSAFLFGAFAGESLLLAEAGQQVGAMQVAGSVTPEQVAFFICTSDYVLIGEELFAASSYLTPEPVQLGSLYGQDRAKLLFFLLLVVGIGIATVNSVWNLSITNVDKLITAPLW